jgi:UDP-N-acetylmuramoyl-L-alanyl-D-glutamate--2,6-diaminopimelate ligase
MKLTPEIIGEDVSVPPLEFSGIQYNSRKVNQGDIFVAITGTKDDGHRYIPEAISRGASAIICSITPENSPIPCIKVSNPRQVLSSLSAHLAGNPTKKMKIIGITGTDGKTTVSYLLRSIYQAAKNPIALSGTLGMVYDSQEVRSELTTPESLDLHNFFHTAYQKGITTGIMEVSSHSLALSRVDHIQFFAAGFTNLTQDHLDFHKDLDHYLKAKARLFQMLPERGVAILNLDDKSSEFLARCSKAPIYFFSCTNTFADFTFIKENSHSAAIEGIVSTPRGAVSIKSKLMGEFNKENILCAIALAERMGLSLKNIQEGVKNLTCVPGRMESLETHKGALIIIDYAHTPGAMDKILQTVKAITINRNGNLWTVFGAGGNRDRTKRPIMGEIADRLSDFIILTDDNPRYEDPDAIIKEISLGINPGRYEIIRPREKAIEYALSHAQPKDVIAVIGKGAEDYQEVQGVRHPYNDRKVVELLVSKK